MCCDVTLLVNLREIFAGKVTRSPSSRYAPRLVLTYRCGDNDTCSLQNTCCGCELESFVHGTPECLIDQRTVVASEDSRATYIVSKFTSLQYVRSYVLRTTRYNVL